MGGILCTAVLVLFESVVTLVLPFHNGPRIHDSVVGPRQVLVGLQSWYSPRG